jgi:hypothetical protein
MLLSRLTFVIQRTGRFGYFVQSDQSLNEGRLLRRPSRLITQIMYHITRKEYLVRDVA